MNLNLLNLSFYRSLWPQAYISHANPIQNSTLSQPRVIATEVRLDFLRPSFDHDCFLSSFAIDCLWHSYLFSALIVFPGRNSNRHRTVDRRKPASQPRRPSDFLLQDRLCLAIVPYISGWIYYSIDSFSWRAVTISTMYLISKALQYGAPFLCVTDSRKTRKRPVDYGHANRCCTIALSRRR